MTKRMIRREYRQFSAEEKARIAEEARKVEAEFPPGKPIPPNALADSMTLGEYFDLRELCARLRQARESRGLSLADVQELTGIDRAQLSRLERGEVHNPTVSTLSRYAKAVGCRVGMALVDADAPAV
jgi:DNA-binding Xre family transcriptional regulator